MEEPKRNGTNHKKSTNDDMIFKAMWEKVKGKWISKNKIMRMPDKRKKQSLNKIVCLENWTQFNCP